MVKRAIQAGLRGRERKAIQLLDDSKGNKGCSRLKAEGQDSGGHCVNLLARRPLYKTIEET